MCSKLIYYVLCCLFFFSYTAVGDPVGWLVKRLSKKLVYTTFKDSRGMIWLGTETGLLLFQGDKFISFNNKINDTTSLRPGIVYSIAEDESGNMWIATYSNGITVFNPFLNTFHIFTAATHPEQLGGNIVNSIAYQGNHTMLLNTGRGAFLINTLNYKWEPALPQEYNDQDIIQKFTLNDADYFLLNHKGVLRRSPDYQYSLSVLPNEDMNFMSMEMVANRLFVTGYSGVFNLQYEKLVRFPVYFDGRDISSSGINNMVFVNSDSIYINSVKYGMLRATVSDNSFQCRPINAPPWFVEGNTLYSAYYDFDLNCFYIGTQQGFYQLKPSQNLINDLVPENLNVGTVRSLYHDGRQLYLGTEGGVYILGDNPAQITKQLSGKSVIISMFRAGDKMYGSGDRFYVFHDNTLKAETKLNSFIPNNEFTIVSCALNDSVIVAICSATREIFFWDRLHNSIRKLELDVSGGITPPLLPFMDGIIIKSYTGLYYLKIPGNSIRKLSEDRDVEISDVKISGNRIYFSSTTGGIKILDEDFSLVRHIYPDPVMGFNDIRSICVKQDNIWFANGTGIGYYNLLSQKTVFFSSGVNFKTDNFVSSSVTESGDHIYFGGDNGVVKVNTAALAARTMKSEAFIGNVSYYDSGELKLVPPGFKNRFSFEQNNLELQLFTTNTGLTSFQYYSYSLNDNLPIPVDAGGLIKLYNLPPGSYRVGVFEIASARLVTEFHFRVVPPWYQTWWFKLLTGFIILGNGIWISSLYYKRKRTTRQKELEKQLALQSERDRISCDMHDDLGSGLSRIKLISQMLQNKYKGDRSHVELTEIVEEAKGLTESMHEMVWSINPQNDTLQKFLMRVSNYAKRFFEYSHFEYSQDIQPDVPEIRMNGILRRNVYLCIKELLNNILKHSEGTKVHMSVTFAGREIRILISENGKGINEHHVPGNGLDSMHKRVSACNGIAKRYYSGSNFITLLVIPV